MPSYKFNIHTFSEQFCLFLVNFPAIFGFQLLISWWIYPVDVGKSGKKSKSTSKEFCYKSLGRYFAFSILLENWVKYIAILSVKEKYFLPASETYNTRDVLASFIENGILQLTKNLLMIFARKLFFVIDFHPNSRENNM